MNPLITWASVLFLAFAAWVFAGAAGYLLRDGFRKQDDNDVVIGVFSLMSIITTIIAAIVARGAA